ncbi:MAG: hypothetical protein IJ358_02280 [Clostridia bacterium]|nr:hypothetical protein [Clostridia bacterium]
MKIFDGIQSFFGSIGEYVKNFSNLFFIFLGAFLLVSVVVIIITSFAYECQLTKTIDKINKFLERNPRINDDNLVAFNNLMKARNVPKTLRRQWQQFMLYREHPASYYMSFKHCVENPLRNSSYRQQMTVYKIVSLLLVVLSLVASTFMAVQSFNANLVLQDIIIIPITILIGYWLVSMVLDLIHNAVSSDLFQNYQYFEINMDKAMLTLPEFVDYEVLFSQDEIRRGIPVLYAYLQKRAIQEQQELEKARIKSVDHEKFDFDQAGLDGSLVLDRAMRETENFSSQRKKYLQEIERVNNEIAALENNYKEQIKEYQRQLQTSKETVENLKEQLEQETSTIGINYIKKQMRDEINRQQLAEKEFDILTDKHNQEIKSLNQEIKHYEEETKKAKEALEVAMLSEFNTYSVKVYDNLEKIVDDKMQDRVDDYKDHIKGLEVQLEEKNEELENVYTRYQEMLSQMPAEPQQQPMEVQEEVPVKKGKKKKKGAPDEPVDDAMVQPEQLDTVEQYPEDYAQYDYVQPNEYGEYQDYNAQEQYDYNQDDSQDYNYEQSDNAMAGEQYVPEEYNDSQYVPLDDNYSQDTYDNYTQDTYDNYEQDGYTDNYVPLDEQGDYIPLDNYTDDQSENDNGFVYEMQNQNSEDSQDEQPMANSDSKMQDDSAKTNINEPSDDSALQEFDDSDFDIDFSNSSETSSSSSDEDFDFGDTVTEEKAQEQPGEDLEEIEEGEFDINKVLGLYDEAESKADEKQAEPDEEISDEQTADKEFEDLEDEKDVEGEDSEGLFEDELPSPVTERRKAGRPRKIVDESEIKPKRKAGRPRKIVEPEVELKRPVGRPKKIVEETEIVEKRPVGRPKKQVVAEKRKVGRPKKEVEQVEQVKRPVGRPKKVVKKHVGRPKKEETKVDTLSAPKRSVGRPKKVQVETTTRKVGRPKKQVLTANTSANKPKGKRGRPRKN